MLILATGVFLTIRLEFLQVNRFGFIFRRTLGKIAAPRPKDAAGEITPFQALSTALAATVFQAWRFGISRGIFTNEAGLGSASIAHAAARTTHPVRQGIWGVVEVFIDTHVICTATALVLLVTGAYASGLEGAAMTAEAFSRGLPGDAGQFVVSIGLSFFAFSTVLSWSYYGEKCFEFIIGSRFISIYRMIWILFIFVGALGGLRVVWALSDILNGFMAFPNLVGLVGLSGLLARLSREFFAGQSR